MTVKYKYKKSIFDQLETPPKNRKYIKFFEKLRWPDKVISPYDPTSKVWKLANNWYKCKNTGKKFNVRTGTVLQYSNIPLRKWYLASCLFASKKGISSYQLAKSLRITFTTAFNLLKDLRSLLDQFNFVKEKLKGVIEADETLVGGSNPNRHWDKKIPNSQGRSCADKTNVWGAFQRTGYLVTEVVPDVKRTTLEPIIRKHVEEGSDIYTDELLSYKGLGRWYNHEIIIHLIKQYVNGKVTTNRIENVWSVFKKTIKGTYHNNISDKYLPNYINELTFRYNTRKYTEEKRLELLFLTMMGKPLTYQEFSRL